MFNDLITIAFSLGILTYYLGVLIISLPIPSSGLKRWGPTLLTDGIYVAVLVFVYKAVIVAMDLLLDYLGSSWGNFFTWLTSRTAVIIGIYEFLTYLKSILGASFIESAVATIANELLKMLIPLLTAIKLIYIYSVVIYNFHQLLVLLGIVLIAIPFRIGRSAGAALIATAIIFYVGLPLLPSFVSLFEGTVISSSAPLHTPEFNTIKGTVYTVVKEPLSYGVLYFIDHSTNEVVGIIKLNSEGKFYIGPPSDFLPPNYKYKVKLSYYGYEFLLEPSVISSTTSTNLSLIAYGILKDVNRYFTILYPTNALVSKVSISTINKTYLIKIFVHVLENTNIIFLYPETTNLSKVLINGEPKEFSAKNSWTWYGIKGYDVSIPLAKGDCIIEVSFNVIKQPPLPDVEEKRIIASEASISKLLMNLLMMVTAYIFLFILLPSAFILLLFLISASLSRVIGGKYVRILRL